MLTQLLPQTAALWLKAAAWANLWSIHQGVCVYGFVLMAPCVQRAGVCQDYIREGVDVMHSGTAQIFMLWTFDPRDDVAISWKLRQHVTLQQSILGDEGF